MSYEDRSSQILAVGVTMFLLAWISVGLRTYTRIFLVKAFGRDDAVMLATVCFFTAFLACEFGGLRYGTGKRRAVLTDGNAQTALRYWFFCEIFYTLCTSTLKIAVGLFLLRIAVVRWHVWIIYAIMSFAAVLGVAYCGIMTFQCNPISFWWDLNPTHHGHCISPKVVIDTTYLVSALNSFADWTFAILPIFIIKDLQMKKQQKVLVTIILGFAVLGSFATIIRAPYIWTMEHYKGEFLWRTSDVAIWTSTEVGIGITASCLATLRPLLKRFTTLESESPSNMASMNPRKSIQKNNTRERKYLQGYETMDEEGYIPFDSSEVINMTTVTAKKDSKNGSRPLDGLPSVSSESLTGSWEEGINKKVVVTTTVERSRWEVDEEVGTLPKPAVMFTRL